MFGLMIELTISLIFPHSVLSFIGIKIPKCDGVTCSMSRLNFVWIPSIWPEECDTIEDGFNVCYPVGPAVGKNPKKSTILCDIPANVQVVYTSNASTISVWIVDMFHVMRAFAFIAGNHRLEIRKKFFF